MFNFSSYVVKKEFRNIVNIGQLDYFQVYNKTKKIRIKEYFDV